jgi:hypothetical protein
VAATQVKGAAWALPEQRLRLLKVLVCAALLSQLALSPRLWTAERSFPQIPVLPGLPDLPFVGVLSGLFALALLLIAALRHPKWPIWAALVLAAVLVIFDTTRLQPWLYQYGLMLVALAAAPWKDESPGRNGALSLLMLIVAATYFWSGVQKLNPAFASSVFPWFFGRYSELARPYWIIAPLLEISIGLALLWPRTRMIGVGGAVCLHLFLLSMLGPLGRNFNPVVWPWNFWMIAIVLALFVRNRDSVLVAMKTPVGAAVAVLVGVMPALNFFGLWDDNLSASLYSGRTREAFILLTREGEQRLPERVRPYVLGNGFFRGLEISRWALDDLGVPPYPEVRVYEALARKLEVPPDEMELKVTRKPSW